jgi:hypothetical protein
MVASLGGEWDGRIVYLNDLGNAKNLTLNGDEQNRIQFASFDPTGERFVAVYGDTSLPDRNRLWFHDGKTGQRLKAASIDLPFEPDHPDWSPDGKYIAIDRVGVHNSSQHPYNCGIELLEKGDEGFGAPETLIPIAPGLSRYNPNFAPDSSFLVYSESTCPFGTVSSAECDGDADDSAKTWAVRPRSGANPIRLDRAGKPGVADGGKTYLADTFPRFSPFQQRQGKGEALLGDDLVAEAARAARSRRPPAALDVRDRSGSNRRR